MDDIGDDLAAFFGFLLILALLAIGIAVSEAGGRQASEATRPPATPTSTPNQHSRTAKTEVGPCGRYSGTQVTGFGDTGERVRKVQCRLLAFGYSVGPDGIDGIFGRRTRDAVRAFQRDTRAVCGPPGLVADSIVGPKTWSALRAVDGCPTR